MDTKIAERYFEDLCSEAIRFLQDRVITCRPQATAINAIKTEFERARLPNPMPEARRLPGCRHLGAALEIAKAGPMVGLALRTAVIGGIRP